VGTFVQIAFQIKNFFIIIAVIFLMIGVIRLLFSNAGEEDLAKWRNNIIWVSVGIFLMQIAFSIWKTLLITDDHSSVGGVLSWEFWNQVIAPIVALMQFLAGFLFLGMMIYAFYMMVTGSGDEERVKKGRSMVIYAIIGFVLVQLPFTIVSLIYGGVPDCAAENSTLWSYAVGPCNSATTADLKGLVGVIGQIFKWLNSFLTVLCVILVIYAGWLVLISGGDEEKLKKAKNIIIYIIIGFVLLIASHAIFRFIVYGTPVNPL